MDCLFLIRFDILHDDVDRLIPCRTPLHDEAEETVDPPPTRPRRSPRRPARLQDCDLS